VESSGRGIGVGPAAAGFVRMAMPASSVFHSSQ
jgi:hypothetical protein